MPTRLAAILALIAFAVCLFAGGWQADNPFTTTVVRALAAMAVTFLVGLVVGHMAKTMLDENLADDVVEPAEKTKVKPKPGVSR
jgi:hypothetical protein